MSNQMSLVSDNYIWDISDRSPDSRHFRTSFKSDSDAYELGEIIRITIPPSDRSFLNTQNSWLNLTISDASFVGTGIVTTSDICMSYIGGSSAFDSVSIIGTANQYVQHSTNYQSMFALNYINNTDVSNGFTNSITNHSATIESADYSKMIGQSVPITIASATSANLTSEIKMSIPLSGILDSSRSLPLGMLASEITLEIYLANDIRKIFWNKAASGSVTSGSVTFKAELDAQIEVVTPNAFREIQSNAREGPSKIISWSEVDQRCSSSTITAAELNSVSLNEKQILVTGVKPRKLQSITSAAFKDPNGSSDPWACCCPWDDDNSGLQLSIGNDYFPPRKIQNRAEIVRHVQECYNQHALTTQSNRITNAAWSRRHPSLLTAIKDDTIRGCWGIDLTSFDKQSDGIDVSHDNILINGNLKVDPQITAAQSYNLIVVKKFAVLYSISEGGDWSVSY